MWIDKLELKDCSIL